MDSPHISQAEAGSVVLAPYRALPQGIALTAWGRIDRLVHYREDRVVAFVEALRGRYHGWTTEQDC